MKKKDKKTHMVQQYNNESYVKIYDKRYRTDQFMKIQLFMEYLNYNSQKMDEKVIMDFGAGTGLFWEYIEKKILVKPEESNNFNDQNASNKEYSTNQTMPLFRLVALDIAFGMLRQYREKLKEKTGIQNYKLEGKNNIHFICCDGEYLPLRNERFDQIFSFTAIQNLPDIHKGLEEIKRTMRSNFTHDFLALSLLKKSFKNLNQLEELFRAYWKKPKILSFESKTGEINLERKMQLDLNIPKKIEDFLILIESE